MSRDLNLLVPEFRQVVEAMLQELRQDYGVEMRPFYTARTAAQQARLWRQSRTTVEIQEQIAAYEREGALWLARQLDSVGPQYGPWVTNAPPGYSWHQWGEAVDCFLVEDWRANWDSSAPGYQKYRQAITTHGLTPGPSWDMVHAQWQALPVSRRYTAAQVDARMEERWG